MDVEQVISHLAKLQQSGRAAVDPSSALALCVNGPAQQQHGLVGVGTKAGVVQPLRQRAGRVELGADLGARRAFAHQADVASTAKCELQRVDQDRLASAGFTRQHRKAGMELKLQRRHDDEIAQRESPQHRSGLALKQPWPGQRHRMGQRPRRCGSGPHQTTPSYQRSLRRKVA